MAVTTCSPDALESVARCFICIPNGLKPAVNVSLLNKISGVNASVSALALASSPYSRFNGSTLGAEVYLLALIAGLAGQSPSQLANAARCFNCGRDSDLDDITGYLYAQQAGGSLDPATLITAATSYQKLFGIESRVALYLTCQWAVSAGVLVACDTQALLAASRCYTNCLDRYLLRALRTYLLCYININGLGGGGSGPTPPTPNQEAVTGWANRVVTNGGAVPSQATQNSLVTFLNALDAAGIRNKMLYVLPIVPDNLIAALTPLIKSIGLDPATNHNFAGGDLTVDGLIGNGTTKFLETGITPAAVFGALGEADWAGIGLDAYQFTEGASFKFAIYSLGASVNTAVGHSANFDGQIYWDCPFAAGAGEIIWAVPFPVAGLYCPQRTTPTAQQTYHYGSTFGLRTGPTNATDVSGNVPNAIPMYLFARNNNGVADFFNAFRFSYFAVRGAFTVGELTSYCAAVQALRVALGGGFA